MQVVGEQEKVSSVQLGAQLAPNGRLLLMSTEPHAFSQQLFKGVFLSPFKWTVVLGYSHSFAVHLTPCLPNYRLEDIAVMYEIYVKVK